jgi:alkylated DNA repair dioxygenase AlkB
VQHLHASHLTVCSCFMESDVGVPDALPLHLHPEWGKTLFYEEQCLPGELAQLLFAQASNVAWRGSSLQQRQMIAFARGDQRERIDYYDTSLCSSQENWPSIAGAFAHADTLLAGWLPARMQPAQPNYLLCNWYPTALSNARWHRDVPEAISDWILSISLGYPRLFLLRANDEAATPYWILLPHNSALLLGPGINTSHVHSVPPCAESSAQPDLRSIPCWRFQGPRLNLTFRRVIEF